MTPETKLKNAVVKMLRKQKFAGVSLWWMKLHGGAMQQAGVPDLLIVFRGRPIFVELKAGKRNLTNLQALSLSEIGMAGGVTCVARSVVEVEDLLRSC